MLNNEKFCLKQSTAIEPLVNQYVAWSHIMSPVPFSMHLKNYQLDVLESYLENPDIHAQSCKNPKLRSGPLVDISPERADEVRVFKEKTESELKQNLRLVNRFTTFHKKLIEESNGESLDSFYEQLPAEIRGYVELFYDYYNRPTIRFIEPMMYESPYYREDLQTLRLFTQEQHDGRAFFMSTPRLDSLNQLNLKIPFYSSLVDDLSKLGSIPQPLGEIMEKFGIASKDKDLLLSLLEKRDSKTKETWKGETARVRYFGHACVLVEWKGVSIMTDPCLGVIPENNDVECYSYDDLPEKIDYVLITHGHHDHFCLETLLRMRHRLETLVIPKANGIYYGDISLKTLAQKLNFKNVVEMDSLDSIEIPDGEILGVPFLGEHADLPHGKCAYVIRFGVEQILFAADSDCLDKQLYINLRKICGKIKNVFIGMECVGAPLNWSCGSFLPEKFNHIIEQSRRYKGCDSARATEILEALGAERLYLYAMGLEPWLEFWLGLAITEDSTQFIEAKKLLNYAKEKRYIEAKLLYGRDEMYLEPEKETVKSKIASAVNQTVLDSEDNFEF